MRRILQRATEKKRRAKRALQRAGERGEIWGETFKNDNAKISTHFYSGMSTNNHLRWRGETGERVKMKKSGGDTNNNANLVTANFVRKLEIGGYSTSPLSPLILSLCKMGVILGERFS